MIIFCDEYHKAKVIYLVLRRPKKGNRGSYHDDLEDSLGATYATLFSKPFVIICTGTPWRVSVMLALYLIPAVWSLAANVHIDQSSTFV